MALCLCCGPPKLATPAPVGDYCGRTGVAKLVCAFGALPPTKLKTSPCRTYMMRKPVYFKLQSPVQGFGALVSPKLLRVPRVMSYDTGGPEDIPSPWVWAFKVVYSSVREVLEFLWEQPGQLQNIEFTPFDSIVKMAFFTLGVVILLIIFLATVDSTFSYILATILRKVP